METRPIPRDEPFPLLVAAVQACRRCPAMEGRRRVLSDQNGRADARVMFIAEAPGRLGGEVTGVPLSRDASGRRFSRLLQIAGLDRRQVFITNAVLCNPRAADGRNRPPSTSERANCLGWLRAQIEVVDPAVVVTLGAVALAALDRIEPHGLRLRDHVGQPRVWTGRALVALYHPSPRAGLSRAYSEQDADFSRLGELVRSLARPTGRCGAQAPDAGTRIL
jgi:uracil-DNA glycosylase